MRVARCTGAGPRNEPQPKYVNYDVCGGAPGWTTRAACARVTRKNTAPRSYLSNPQLGRVNNKMNHVRRVASPSGERTPGGADYSEKFVYRSGHPRPAAVPCVPRAVGAPQACPQVPPLPAGVRAAGEKEKPPNRTERGTNRGTRTPVAARRRSSEKSTARLIRS